MPRFSARSMPTSSMSGLMSLTVTCAPLGGHAEGDVAGAAGHVEDRLAGARLHLGDEAVLPQPVHAARHQVVHQVVVARDGREDPADAARSFPRA